MSRFSQYPLAFWRRSWAPQPAPDFPVTRIPAIEVRAGMTIVAMPEGWIDVRPDSNGHWPVVIEDAEFLEHGEGGLPCVYWTTDEPDGRWNYWCFPKTTVTIAAQASQPSPEGR